MEAQVAKVMAVIRTCYFCQRELQRLIVFTLDGETIWGCRTCNKNGTIRDFFKSQKKEEKNNGTNTDEANRVHGSRSISTAGEESSGR